MSAFDLLTDEEIEEAIVMLNAKARRLLMKGVPLEAKWAHEKAVNYARVLELRRGPKPLERKRRWWRFWEDQG